LVDVEPKLGIGVVLGRNVQLGAGVVIWNYVVVGDNVQIGDGTRIGSFCDIGRDVKVGRECIIQAHVTVSNGCKIGNKVFIGPNAMILNDKYPISNLIAPPIIGDDVIIGGGAIIMPGVRIENRAVIAAGSIVTKSVDAGVVVKGTPAKPFMSREEYEAKRRALAKKSPP